MLNTIKQAVITVAMIAIAVAGYVVMGDALFQSGVHIHGLH